MYRPPIGNMQRAPPITPPRPAHQNLTIRTSSLQPTQSSPAPQSSVSAPPEQPYPVYPIPIPADKLEKALRLYKIYKTARYQEGLASRQLDPQSATSNHHGYYLSVPGTPAPRSTTSRTSSQRRRAESVSTSNYGAVTDISSVMSFDGNESPSKSKTELSTWDGKKVKQRRRRKFPEAAKAKTALVRHLGSCWVCHKRRVPCDLEQHHDVKTLESLLKSKSNAKRSVSAPQAPTISSISGVSQQNAGLVSTEQGSSGNIQTNALLGMGQNEHLQSLTPFDSTDPSTFDDPIADIDISAPATQYYPQLDLSSLASSSNPSYQNGGMLPIGIRRGGYFHCEHYLCSDFFNNAEEVQLHFEISHFPFTRINPAHRYVCVSCEHMNDVPTGPCYNCGSLGQIEIRIYGNYIEPRTYQRYSTDGHDLQNNSSSTPYYPSAYDVPNSGVQGGPDMNGGDFNGGGFNGGTNPGNYYYQPNGSFGNGPGSSNQSYGYNQYDNMGANGNQYGQGFRQAKHDFEEKTHSGHVTQGFRWQRLLFALATLSLASILCFSYTGLFTKLRSFLVRSIATHMPVLGFFGIVTPLAMCSIVKHFTVQRVRSAQCRPQKCPLHTLRSRPMRWMGCRQTAPDTYIRGGIHS